MVVMLRCGRIGGLSPILSVPLLPDAFTRQNRCAMRVSRAAWQQLKPGDDYSTVVAKLGAPAAQRTFVDDGEGRNISFPRLIRAGISRLSSKARRRPRPDMSDRSMRAAESSAIRVQAMVCPARHSRMQICCVPYLASDTLKTDAFSETCDVDCSGLRCAALCLGAIAVSRGRAY